MRRTHNHKNAQAKPDRSFQIGPEI
jgi:hypothetical protein